jgi:transcriptional regulator with XRE-family HTH domain
MPRKRDPARIAQIGARVRALRQARGLTQEALAEALGVQPTAVTRFETGAVGLSLTTLCELAEVLGVPAGFLVGDEGPGGLGGEERLLLRDFRTLDPAHRATVLAVLRWARADQGAAREAEGEPLMVHEGAAGRGRIRAGPPGVVRSCRS